MHKIRTIPSWSYPNGIVETRLRLSANEKSIETPRGAEVTVKLVRVLYHKIVTGRDVNGNKFNGFTVINYIDDILTVGCHKIERKEIDRLAIELKWIKEEV